jgi:hypothetical protein
MTRCQTHGLPFVVTETVTTLAKEVNTIKTAEVAVVHEDDVIEFLKAIGVAADYESGDLVCVVCGTPLIGSGLGAARGTAEGTFEFACARLDCLDEFHSRRDAV